MRTEDVIARTADKVYLIGAAFYFAPETLAIGTEAGLDGFRFYFLGRGGVLGDVEAPVIASAFGYFEPGLLATMWNSGKETIAPRDAARLFMGGAHEFGRAKFSGVGELDGFCAAAEKVIAAADPTSLALFAGYLGEPLAEDAPARAIQLAIRLRELRGCVHLVAVVASGVTPKTAHYLRRPNDFGLFGWTEDAIPVVTDAHREALAAADSLTDRLLLPCYEVLDDAEREAFVAGIGGMAAAL